MAMRTQAPKRYRDKDISAMKRYRFNPYKEALLNPISGPLVGVPTAVPIDTHRVRLKSTGTISLPSGVGACTVLVNPVDGLQNDLVPAIGTGSVNHGAINIWQATSGSTTGLTSLFTNSQYTRAQFAALTNNSSVRGRVVSACLRICNVSANNDRNGVFTLYKDPQHNTLQGKTASNVGSDNKAQQYNASTPDWHTILYHPVEPEEVDGWVWDPFVGPQAGVKTGSYIAGNAADATPADNFPGYMGIWWNGDPGKSQTFQVELYIIAEYVGSLVQPLVSENPAVIADMMEATNAAETHPVFHTPATEGSHHTGHPLADTIHKGVNFVQQHGDQLKAGGNIINAGLHGDYGEAAKQTANLIGSIIKQHNITVGAKRPIDRPAGNYSKYQSY